MQGALSPGENNSIRIAPLCGIDIYIHAFLPYYAIYRILGGLAAYGSTGLPVGPFLIFNCVAVTLLFTTVLIHEYGHSFMAIFLGGQVPKILLWPFGGLAYCNFTRDVKSQLAVSCAGPATHIPLFCLWFVLWKFTRKCSNEGFDLFMRYDYSECLWDDVLMEAMMLQIMLFAFNVFLPIYPLDGGKIFICLLAMCCECNVSSLAKWSIGVSSILGGGLLAMAIWSENWFMGFLCLWLLYQVYNMYDCLRNGQIAQHPLFENMPGGFYNARSVASRDELGSFHSFRTDEQC